MKPGDLVQVPGGNFFDCADVFSTENRYGDPPVGFFPRGQIGVVLEYQNRSDEGNVDMVKIQYDGGVGWVRAWLLEVIHETR